MGGRIKSDFLVSSPSMVSGASRLLDLYGQFDEYNSSKDGSEADGKAIYADWRIVGEDINDAMAEFEVSAAA